MPTTCVGIRFTSVFAGLDRHVFLRINFPVSSPSGRRSGRDSRLRRQSGERSFDRVRAGEGGASRWVCTF